MALNHIVLENTSANPVGPQTVDLLSSMLDGQKHLYNGAKITSVIYVLVTSFRKHGGKLIQVHLCSVQYTWTPVQC